MNQDSRSILSFLGFLLVCALLNLAAGCGELPSAPSRAKVQPIPEFQR